MHYLSRTAMIAGLSMLYLLAVVAPVSAAETASSELVIIREGDTLEEDLYATGVRIIIEGVINGDLTAFAAEEVIISGQVTGSVVAVAPTVTVSGDVGGALRTTANVLEVSGSVGSDLVAAAVGAGLRAGSVVGGDVVVWAVNLEAAGTIRSNLEGTQRTTRVEGTVNGDVGISVRRLIVTGPLEVAGDLGYRSEIEADGLDQASVGGVTVHKAPLPPNIRIRALALLARLLAILGLTTAAMLVAWGWPDRTRRAAEQARGQLLKAYGFGAMVMLSPFLLGGVAALVAGLTPAAASLPLLAIFGPLVVATAGLVLVLSLVAGVPAVLALGELLPPKLALYGSILAGSALVALLWMVPLAGWLVPLVVLPTGLGAWMLSFRQDLSATTER
ncbi:MAG TPA: hypothetical protein VGC03_16980 [Acidimicrobiia bacterium]|jgi:hypothetical protein